MDSIRLEFDPPDYRRGEDFDRLGRAAAELLAHLFPPVQVSLKYTKQESAPRTAKGAAARAASVPAPGHVRTYRVPVPGESGWWRELTVVVSDAGRRFLGLDTGGTAGISSVAVAGKPKTVSPLTGHRVPRELEYAVRACEHVSHAWLAHLGGSVAPEIHAALAAQLPVLVVSYITAGALHGFAADSSRRSQRDTLARAVARVIEYLQALAGGRVEHEALSHGVVIAPPTRTEQPLNLGIYPDDFEELKRTPLLADGVRAALWISPAREPIGWLTTESLRRGKRRLAAASGPFGELGLLAEAARTLGGVGIGLSKNGSIVIFVKEQPLFIRRLGKWSGTLWRVVREVLGARYGEVGTTVFEAAVILSATGYGGVLGLVEALPEGVHDKDRVHLARHKAVRNGGPRASERGSAERPHPEWLFHALLPSDQVVNLGAPALAMVASIDGATLVSREGNLLAYGAIIPIRPSGSVGARSAVARELSYEGFIIKVSCDGPISLYEGGKKILEV
jgi:hypothetical protein